MSFVEVVDVGMTPRRKLTPHRRLQVWERTAGICVICHRKIDGVREHWNMGPAHETCASIKTQDDHRRAAKAKRQKIHHIGAHTPRRPLPFGKASAWKKTLSGRIIPR
jgi:hypothetical protein